MTLNQNYDPKQYEQEIYKAWMKNGLGGPEKQVEKQNLRKNQINYLIFDCDGVLADSWDFVIKAYTWGGFAESIEESILYQINRHQRSPFAKDAQATSHSINKNHSWHDKEWEYYQKFGGYESFSGFVEVLKKLQNCQMAVVSSNDDRIVNDFCKKTGLNFSHIWGFETNPSKEEKVEMICKEWGVSEVEVLFFTDTKSDVLELEEFLPKDNIFGVDWGWHGSKHSNFLKKYDPNFEGLESVLPKEQILYHFEDIFEITQRKNKNTHCILMPPPNLTGVMHAGHSFQHFLMDTLSRVNRQKGVENLWYPGVDHAGIQLEGVIDKLIKKGEFDEELKNFK